MSDSYPEQARVRRSGLIKISEEGTLIVCNTRRGRPPDRTTRLPVAAARMFLGSGWPWSAKCVVAVNRDGEGALARDAQRGHAPAETHSEAEPTRERGLLRWLGRPSGEETDRVINSRSGSSAPAGYRFPREVIAVAVRWYLRYSLSYHDVEELLAERGITPWTT